LRLYRLDAVDRVRIGPDGVRYRDLLLDALIRPRDGELEVRLDDEDEVEAAIASGLLDAHAARRVRWARELFLRRPEAITRRVDAAITLAIETVRGSS
jgi:predicted RNA-binding protein associated with RNAse of E/G family